MSPILLEIIIILALILLNGLFSMSETAVVSSRKLRLQQRAGEGDQRAQRALALTENPDRFLATVQIGITLIGILTGVFGGATISREIAGLLAQIPALAPYSQALAGGLVVLMLTYFSLVLGELAPKRLALNSPERIAGNVAGPMTLLSRLAAPVVRLLTVSTNFVIRLLGIKPAAEAVVTPDEIMLLVGQGAETGVFEAAEQDMIERVLALDERRLETMMTPRNKIVTLDVHDAPEDVRRKLRDCQHSRYPVVDGTLDDVMGTVRTRDILYQNLAGEPFDLHPLLRPPLYLPESTTPLRVLELFKQLGTHVGLVLDEYGGVQGMVTHNDLLEALVGYDISEEAPAAPRIVLREDGSWLIDGLTPIDELREAVGLAWEQEETERGYQTLGGLVMDAAGGVPAVGQRFERNGLRFEVVDMDGRRVDKVLVTRMT